MNGAESLVKTFLASGVDLCFANPGTSEMHFVAALDAHPEMRCVLCLFEGGCSGAADGYFRMTRRVAATMFHLAPGFGNAFANLHNARKAGSGVVNVMGDHASHHLRHESPLKGDTEGISRAISHWTRAAMDAGAVARDGAEAIRAARAGGGRIATLILPADAAWGPGGAPVEAAAPPPRRMPAAAAVAAAARRLREPGTVLLAGAEAGFGEGLERAAAIAAATGARLVLPLFQARWSQGAGRPAFDQLPYPPDQAAAALAEARAIVLLGARPPVNFFAYPGKPSTPEPPGCPVVELAAPEMDVPGALAALAEAVGADSAGIDTVALDLPALPTGPLTLKGAGAALAHLMPEGTVVVNESVTARIDLMPPLKAARPHEMLISTGGAIGSGLPLALGAAIACPERKVVCLSGDGSAMYTLQALWTMARERLNVLIVVVANRGYQILRGELAALGVDRVGRNAQAMFDVENPELDWVALARGHGVPGRRVETNEDAAAALAEGFATEGPYLVELKV